MMNRTLKKLTFAALAISLTTGFALAEVPAPKTWQSGPGAGLQPAGR